MGSFPNTRMRRMRRLPALRRMARETTLSASDFIYPIFVTHGRDVMNPVDPMPGIFQLSLDRLIDEVGEVSELGVPAVLLFGVPARKDPEGKEAYDAGGIVQEAVRVIKQTTPGLIVATDVCLCEYTDHGHCGLISDGRVDNDLTLELLALMAERQVEAGADIVGPSAMMDGQVGAIREALDARGFVDTSIMSYSAKYASAFYGPFRVAAGSTPQFGNRADYQMDSANADEALREIEADIEEGADIVMVKPAMAYLDVVRSAKEAFGHPLAAYNVSGEYAMVKAAAENEWIDGRRIVMEVLTSIKRAGADLIISYHAKEAARWLRNGA